MKLSRVKSLSPFHIPPLGPPQRQYTMLGQNIQAHRINPLLIDQNEILGRSFSFSFRIESLITDEVLEVDDLFETSVDVTTFGFDEFLTLFGGGVEEARIDFAIRTISSVNTGEPSQSKDTSSMRRTLEKTFDSRLFVFQRYIQCQNKSILDPLRHIRVSRSMIHHQTPDKSRIRFRLMLHLHDFHHM